MALTTARIKFTGLKALDRKLQALPTRARKRVFGKAARKAAKPVILAARALVPTESGLLRKSLGVRIRTYRRSTRLVAVIGPRQIGVPGYREGLATSYKRRNPANYGHLVEGGTKPHAQPKWIYQRHPGSDPKPFLGPAWKANIRRVTAILKRELTAGIKAEAKRK